MIYFSIKELCNSNTADKLHIDNTTKDPAILLHLNTLIDSLDKLREAWSAPIRVTSGYRCPKLNKAVGGSSTSAHVKGYAADILPKDMKDFDKFVTFIRKFYSNKNNGFDLIILEHSGSSKWVHISVDPRHRRQWLQYNNGVYKEWK